MTVRMVTEQRWRQIWLQTFDAGAQLTVLALVAGLLVLLGSIVLMAMIANPIVR